ncbi:MAG TPA: hypothetical protein VEC12_13380 [Bacteroidia bacterium]|nr:hypothetical protein [Bacteroidia bacterium]
MLRKSSGILLLLLMWGQSFSQNLTRSPFSGLGVGDLQFYGFAHQQSMGRLTQGYRREDDYSITNPASYAGLKYTVYQVGAHGTFSTVESPATTQQYNTFSLGYFSLGIPISTRLKWGGAFGLQPYSAIGYNSFTESDDNIAGSYTTRRSGSGGINRFYLGMGIQPFRPISVGFNASYLFGQIVSTERLAFNPDSSLLDYREDRTRFISGFNFDIGIQYQDTIARNRATRNNWVLGVGVTLHMGSDVNSTQQLYGRTVLNYFGTEYHRDTIAFNDGVRGKITLPQGLRAGFGLGNTGTGARWFFGAEYFMQQWKDFSSHGVNGNLADLQTISAGMSFQPVFASRGTDLRKGYLKYVVYRAGFSYSNTQFIVNNNQVDEYGINFGLGFPVRAMRGLISTVNLGAEYNSRGSLTDNLIREKYFRLTIGLTLTDKWFDKYKYD